MYKTVKEFKSKYLKLCINVFKGIFDVNKNDAIINAF